MFVIKCSSILLNQKINNFSMNRLSRWQVIFCLLFFLRDNDLWLLLKSMFLSVLFKNPCLYYQTFSCIFFFKHFLYTLATRHQCQVPKKINRTRLYMLYIAKEVILFFYFFRTDFLFYAFFKRTTLENVHSIHYRSNLVH